MLIEENGSAFLALAMMLAAASYFDVKSHRIPNAAIFGGAFIALAMQLWFVGLSGFLTGIGGMVIGLLFLMPFYVHGGMAAGDVKLMVAAGAFLGPLESALAAAITLMVGAVGGGAVLAMRGGLNAACARYLAMGKCIFFTGQVNYLPPAQGEAASSRFPYAAAIAIGVLTVVFWHPFGV